MRRRMRPMAALLALIAGCGSPQVASENRDLVESVVTAVSAKNTDWLAANERKIAERQAAGKLASSEASAFDAILAKARAGDWDAAADLAYRLRDAQAPTAEDRDRVARRAVE